MIGSLIVVNFAGLFTLLILSSIIVCFCFRTEVTCCIKREDDFSLSVSVSNYEIQEVWLL